MLALYDTNKNYTKKMKLKCRFYSSKKFRNCNRYLYVIFFL